MPVIRRGKPRLAAGSAGLERKVRWVHIAEVADIGHLLRGGELVLTTGIALPADDAAGDPSERLARWAERSRSVSMAERTAYHPGTGWLVTIVGARGNDWGRLVLVSADQPPHRHVVVAERAASALALNRLVARDR